MGNESNQVSEKIEGGLCELGGGVRQRGTVRASGKDCLFLLPSAMQNGGSGGGV